jgi:hypothetical protein
VRAEEEDDDGACMPLGRRAWEENKKLLGGGGALHLHPLLLQSSFGVRHRVISQAFVGHIGATELAAYALVSTRECSLATSLVAFFNPSLVLPLFFFCCQKFVSFFYIVVVHKEYSK